MQIGSYKLKDMRFSSGKLRALLTGFLFFFCMNLNAQKSLSEVTLFYEIILDGASGSGDAKAIQFNVYIKGAQSRTDMVSVFGTESNLYDSKTGKGIILKDYSGQKLLITLEKSDWVKRNYFFSHLNFDFQNEYKNINGFECLKATALTEEGGTLEVYYTNDKSLLNYTYNTAFPGLSGIPVQFNIIKGKRSYLYRLKSMNTDPLSSVKFETPVSGYRIISYEEALKLNAGEK